MSRIGLRAAVLCLGLLCTFASAPSQAQAPAWPQRPVKFIVTLGPGSGVDIGAREQIFAIVRAKMENALALLGSATPSFTHDTRDEQTRPKNKISPPVIPSALRHAALRRGTRHGA